MLQGKKNSNVQWELRWGRVLQTGMNVGSLHGGGGICQSLMDEEENRIHKCMEAGMITTL